MGIYKIKDLTFSYPGNPLPALCDISLNVEKGEFITLIGPSGCGKTTLLRHLKTVLAPHGSLHGEIYFCGASLPNLELERQCAEIGFVMQDPDAQIVTDKVWHELAFGLESLGLRSDEIRRRVAEISNFFGIQDLFHKNVSELSGGQKQVLCLASIMVMNPSVLLLDEPTSMLDPIAASNFLSIVGRINRELGVTVIITEHRLDEVFPLSTRVIAMENGRITCDGTPETVGPKVIMDSSEMARSMPSQMLIHTVLDSGTPCPLSIASGRSWLSSFSKGRALFEIPCRPNIQRTASPAVSLSDVYFRYKRDLSDVLRCLSFKAYPGEITAVLGGNGSGKTTLLSIISGILKPQSGKTTIFGRDICEVDSLYNGVLGILFQNARAMFSKKTVYDDLMDVLSGSSVSQDNKHDKIMSVASLCRIESLLDRHPYDLSGGEMQRAALAKVLLLSPRIILLDEPTKGMDGNFKHIFASILNALKKDGVAVIMTSHDIEFCAKYADTCSMFFDGQIISSAPSSKFFSTNTFYTTASRRLSLGIIEGAVTPDDVVFALTGTNISFKEPQDTPLNRDIPKSGGFSKKTEYPQKERKISVSDKRISPFFIWSIMILLVIVPLTVFAGYYFFGDRKYYFISLLIIIETIIPFVLSFERRRPNPRELVAIAVLCAIAVAGRIAFSMIPAVKPVLALITIIGVALGAETGFMSGAICAFASNFFMGQGPWTPWQMLALGLVGFVAGFLFYRRDRKSVSRVPICIYGFLSTLLIYGFIMNISSVMMFQSYPNFNMLLTAISLGLPFDIILAVSTLIFLIFLSSPILEKIDRIKIKYGFE